MKTFILLLICAILFSCNDNNLDALGNVFQASHITPSLKPFVDEFIKEGEKRGVHIQVNHLTIQFNTIGGNQAGKTFRYSHTIFIDKKNAFDLKNVVFHEMGHLYLNREHDNTFYGRYTKSIMNCCDAPYYDDSKNTREYYYDELFNSNTPRPDWTL